MGHSEYSVASKSEVEPSFQVGGESGGTASKKGPYVP